MRIITIDDLYRYSSPIREWGDRRIINAENVNHDVSFDIVRCYECKFLIPLPDDIPEGVKADEIDRVCTYWMSDGLNWNGFCSKGIRGEYEGDPIWGDSIEN